MLLKSVHLAQPQFGLSPKGLNVVDMRRVIGKFMTAMFNSKMFCIAHIDSSMIPTPTLRMNHTIEVHRASYGLLQRTFAHIRHTFRRDPAMAFEQAKKPWFYCGCHDLACLGYVWDQSKIHRLRSDPIRQNTVHILLPGAGAT